MCLWVSLTIRESVKPGDYWKTLHLSYPDSCCPSGTGLSKLCVYLFPLPPCALCFHFHWIIECPGTFLFPQVISASFHILRIRFIYLFFCIYSEPLCCSFPPACILLVYLSLCCFFCCCKKSFFLSSVLVLVEEVKLYGSDL